MLTVFEGNRRRHFAFLTLSASGYFCLTPPTNKPVWANYLTDQKNFTGHMFSMKLEEKSYKMSFKALSVKIQRSKNRRGVTVCPPKKIGLTHSRQKLRLEVFNKKKVFL